MEWGMKMASWDLAELERESEPNIGSVVAASTGEFGSQKSNLDCSVDLKLGRLGDFKPPNKSKRARAISNGSQKAACLVDGCKSDLSGCREYHRRHKVCEAHSKTPTVMVGGQEQRFCQQCSRFHLLGEFDEVKRSCRKRLDGHNRRRRKPQPEAIHASTLLPHLQGPMFSSYHMCQTSAPAYSTWCPRAKLEEDSLHKFQYPHFFDRCQRFHITNSHNYEDMKRFPFLQNISTSVTSGTTLETSACQPLLNTISFSQNRTNSSKIYSNGLTHVIDSDCVLSLLSSPTQTHGVNLSCTVPTERLPIAQTMSQSLHHLGRYSRSQSSTTVSATGFSCSAMDDEQVSDILVPDAELQPSGLFQVGGDGSSDGPSIVLPSSW